VAKADGQQYFEHGLSDRDVANNARYRRRFTVARHLRLKLRARRDSPHFPAIRD